MAYRDQGHEKKVVVMRFLRTVSTGRLLALIGGLVVAIGGGTAIAVAASGSADVPKREPLAQAIRQALAAPAVNAISARITFTNHLIDASNIQGTDPILQGASGRIWYSSGHGVRLELQGNNGDGQVVVNNRSWWIYDPTSNTAYEGTLPAGSAKPGAAAKDKASQDALPTIAAIQADINKFLQHANLSGALPTNVGGRPTYTVRISPKHDGGLLGSAELAWDAVKGVPLRVAVYARGDGTPVLELALSHITYGSAPASDFKISPPQGAKIVSVSTPASGATDKADAKHKTKHAKIVGVAAVARHLSFSLAAPAKLIGLPRQSVSLLDWGGTPAALVTYGQNLGGIAVIEQPAKSTKASAPATSGDHRGLSLPTVSINGKTGQELDTALGTVVRFTRGAVTYTVLGSVPAAAAELAARSL